MIGMQIYICQVGANGREAEVQSSTPMQLDAFMKVNIVYKVMATWPPAHWNERALRHSTPNHLPSFIL